MELYFDEIGRQRQCVEFDVSQEIVMNPKPARVKVYDYYETSKSISQNSVNVKYCNHPECWDSLTP